MKKYLPFLLLILGLLVFSVVFLVLRSNGSKEVTQEEEKSALVELTEEQKPVVSLIPSPEGHYLKLRVTNLDFGATSMDYLLLYKTLDIQQGVPGSFDISDKDFYEADLLLGSESSGKFRYDEGVEFGQIDLRFNDSEGNLMLSFSLPFHLQSGVAELTSVDSDFSYKIDKVTNGIFYVTMKTYGTVDSSQVITSDNGYSVFSSDEFVKKSGGE